MVISCPASPRSSPAGSPSDPTQIRSPAAPAAQDLAGPVVRNCDAGDANEQIGGGSTHEESTSVTGTVSLTQGLNFLDLVDTQVSASISVGHTWTTSTETNYSVNKTIPSNYVRLDDVHRRDDDRHRNCDDERQQPGADQLPQRVVCRARNQPDRKPGSRLLLHPHSQAMTPDQIQQFCGSQPPGVGTLNAAQTHAFLATVSPTTTDH